MSNDSFILTFSDPSTSLGSTSGIILCGLGLFPEIQEFNFFLVELHLLCSKMDDILAKVIKTRATAGFIGFIQTGHMKYQGQWRIRNQQ